MEKYIKILEEWIEVDRKIRQNSTESDFDKFCEEKNIAIENVINRVKELEQDVEKEKIYYKFAKDLIEKYYKLVNDIFKMNSENFIAKSKIKEKIDYYTVVYEIGKLHEDEASKYQMSAILVFIEDLQKLLEG